MAMAQMPLPRLAQVGFPTRPCPVEQTADHFRAKKLDQVGGDAALQVRGGSVAETTAFADRAHVAPFQQDEDRGAVTSLTNISPIMGLICWFPFLSFRC